MDSIIYSTTNQELRARIDNDHWSSRILAQVFFLMHCGDEDAINHDTKLLDSDDQCLVFCIKTQLVLKGCSTDYEDFSEWCHVRHDLQVPLAADDDICTFLLARAEAIGYVDLRPGVFLVSQEDIITDQKNWGSGDDYGYYDFTQAPHWIITDSDDEPIAIHGSAELRNNIKRNRLRSKYPNWRNGPRKVRHITFSRKSAA